MSEITRPTQILYRLPSGALTERHLSWEALAPARLRPAEIAFTLAGKLRTLLPGEDLSGLQLVLWQALPDAFGDALQRATSSNEPVYRVADEHLNFRYGEFSPFRPGQQVALITDSLLTGRTASSVLNALRRMEAVPRAVLCIIDGRLDHGAPLSNFSGSVPVASCISRRLVIDDPRGLPVDVKYVDTQDRADSDDRRDDEKLAMRFVSWLADDASASIYIAHVERGRARHFSTYLNVGHVVTTHPEAIDLLVQKIALRVDALSGDGPPLCIVFPAEEGGFAEQLAAKASDRLAVLTRRSIQKVPARRKAGGAWDVLGGPWPDRFTAVIIDWGAVTTATIRGLMTLAAQRGADRVHVVVLTSQLDEDSERSVTSIASIRAHRYAPFTGDLLLEARAEDVAEAVTVPVTVDFLSRVPMGIATSNDCHLCQLAQQMRAHASQAPTRFLRDLAERKYELYRPRSRAEVLREPPTDLVRLPLTADAVTEFWLIRQRLAVARTSTSMRTELRSELLGWPPDSGPRGQSWLRLLVVEPYWLKRPPLDGEDVRARIAAFCVQELLTSAEPDPLRRLLRWQSAIGLRIASKRLFVERFGDVLLASADDETVAAELCSGMYTLLERPYNHHPFVMKKLLVALLNARDGLVDRRRGDPLARHMLFTVSALYRRAVEIQTRVSGPDDSLSAWHALQSSYVAAMNTHAGASTSMLVVLNAFSGPFAKRAAESSDKQNQAYWSGVAEAWFVCWDFLSQNVFPFVPRLRDVLELSSFGRVSGGGDAIDAFDSGRAARFGESLGGLEREPGTFTSDVRRDLEREAFAWFDSLLRAPEAQAVGQPLAPFQGSQLLRIVSENPCDLRQAWEASLAVCSRAGLVPGQVVGSPPAGVSVFCRRSLLIDTFSQVVDNAVGRRHAAPDQSRAGITLSMNVEVSDASVNIVVRNDGTIASGAEGGGLSFYATELAAFRGQLDHRVAVDAPWTYEVRMSLRPWGT